MEQSCFLGYAGAWICREAHAPAGMSVLSKSGMWGSGKCGEEPREGFQQLKGLQESWRGTFIRGMEWLNKEKDLRLKEGRLN